MATAFPLDDHIHCSVCFNIYTHPHSLRCLHTFCHQCILQLQQGTSIDCPECRKPTAINEITKDFKTQTFLDWHFKQTEEASAQNKTDLQVKIPSNCELCSNKLKHIHSKCINCNQYFCLECANSHKLITVCKHHILQSVADIVNFIHTKAKENIKSLQKENAAVSKTSNGISVRIRDIQQSKLKQLADVKKYKEEIFAEIEEYCHDLNSKIAEVNDELIQNLTASQQQFNKVLDEIKRKIENLSKITETQDLYLLSEKASSTSFDMQSFITKIKEQIPSVNTKAKSPVDVNKHVAWDVSKTVSVTVDGAVYSSPNFKPNEGLLFTEMLKHKYNLNQEIQLSMFPHRISLINDELWIAGNDGIHVYNLECQRIREISDQCIKYSKGVVQAHNGNIIVPTTSDYNNGVHLLNHNGEYIQKIAAGRFSDVASFKHQIYCLQYVLHKIVVYEEANKQWTQVKQIPLTFQNGDNYDKLCVKDTGIYVTSYKNICLFHHKLDGEYVYQTGSYGKKAPGIFNFQRICDVDVLGNVLVAYHGHGCLDLYSTDSKWQILDIPVTGPRDAVVDQDASNIWVVTSGNKLQKFTKV